MTTELATVTLEDVDRRLTTVERGLRAFAQDTSRRFDAVDRRLDRIESRLDVLESKVDRILELLESAPR